MLPRKDEGSDHFSAVDEVDMGGSANQIVEVPE